MNSYGVLFRSGLPRFSSSFRRSSLRPSVRPSAVVPSSSFHGPLLGRDVHASSRLASSSFKSASSSFHGPLLGLDVHASSRLASSSFKSAYAIDKIYPGCSAADIANLVHGEYAKPYSVEARDKFTGYIPSDALEIRSCRSSGPGGQSVNTSNTKVEVRFDVERADWIPLWIKKQFAMDQKHRINKRHEFVISSEKTRTQLLNQADCLDRIRHYIREAEIRATPREVDPEEEELRRKRERKANERRLVEKKRNSLNKRGRSEHSW